MRHKTSKRLASPKTFSQTFFSLRLPHKTKGESVDSEAQPCLWEEKLALLLQRALLQVRTYDVWGRSWLEAGARAGVKAGRLGPKSSRLSEDLRVAW